MPKKKIRVAYGNNVDMIAISRGVQMARKRRVATAMRRLVYPFTAVNSEQDVTQTQEWTIILDKVKCEIDMILCQRALCKGN